MPVWEPNTEQERTLQAKAEELRHVHIYGRFYEALRLIVERIERLEAKRD